MPQPPNSPPIFLEPEDFGGKWANAADLVRTPHEITLDFVRMGPMWQQGKVVSRVSFSPLLLSQLVDLFNDEWERYTQEAGIPPEEPDVGTEDSEEGGGS